MARFVVHHHFARTEHYDLRLEMDFVLRSWAIPKDITLAEKKRILVIEDEAHIADGIQLNLSIQGYAVSIARDGIEGLEKLRADEFDVAIVDMKMPKMNGIDMINQALTSDDVDANLIIISTPHESNKGDVIKALNIGVDAWFEKSELQMPQLLKRVTELAQVIPPDMVRRVTSMIQN